MRPLGEVKTFEPIADITAMPTFVECVYKLPDPKTVPAGTVFRLIDSQVDYVAMHFYMCNEYEPGKFEWLDLTYDNTIAREDLAIATLKRVKSGGILLSYKLTISNFPPDHGEDDDFKRDVLVGKHDAPPTCVEDGVEMFSSTDILGVTDYPVAVSKIGRPDECHYRIFRVFKSGYTFYKDATITN